MASKFKRGSSLLIPYRDGWSISDSQGKPRMYKTKKMFEKAFPKHYLGTDGVELVEYAEVRHGRWVETVPKGWHGSGYFATPKISCPFCNESPIPFSRENYEHGGNIVSYQWVKTRHCPNCGAKMDLEG